MSAAPLPAGSHPAAGGASARDLTAMLGAALLRAAVVVLLAAAVVGGLAFGPLAWLPGPALPFYGAGIGMALVAGMLALVLHGRFLDPKATAPFGSDARLLAGRLQGLLAAAFAAKLGVLVLAFFVLRQFGAKFADTATFCITFAAAALLYQLVAAGVLVRLLRPRNGGVPGGASSRGRLP